ncbi:hypothetical protein HDU96_005480 [Phlyctochytrium bullatum]|nr:hypothetical protein HDU96_005480 [Phlyctochytrium bullatum]
MGPHHVPGSRAIASSEWMPYIIGGATCVLAAGILYTVYVLQYPIIGKGGSRRRRNGKGNRRRHLDIDVDLTDPLALPGQSLINPPPPSLHYSHPDELLNAALGGKLGGGKGPGAHPIPVAPSQNVLGTPAVGIPPVLSPPGGGGINTAAQMDYRMSAELNRDVLKSPWNDGTHELAGATGAVGGLASDSSLGALGGYDGQSSLTGYHIPSSAPMSTANPSIPTITTTSFGAAASMTATSPYLAAGFYYPSSSSGYNTALSGNAGAAGGANRHLDPDLVRSVVNRLLDCQPPEPPDSAFSGAVAAFSGRPMLSNRRIGLAIRPETQLPPFTQQINHLITEIRKSKQRGKPLLVEGIPGLGKAAALQRWVYEEATERRPALYLQLSKVLRKRHGGSSIEDDEDVAIALGYDGGAGGEADFFTETETENEAGEERVVLTVKRDAFKKAVELALGADPMEASMMSMTDSMLGTPTRANPRGSFSNDPSGTPRPGVGALEGSGGEMQLNSADSAAHEEDDDDDEDDEDDYRRGRTGADLTILEHVAQALRLIAAKSKNGPTLFVMDDVQLLFRDRQPLYERYDGIAEVFSWLLKCESEGILDVVLCSSEKSTIAAIKRLRGYDWRLSLHCLEGVEDDVVIEYLLKDVNPRIKEPPRRFTPDTAALFVATFNGSLLELDNYFRDVNCNVFMFIKKRERSFLRHLQRHMPQRANRTPLTPPTSRKYGMAGGGGYNDLSNSMSGSMYGSGSGFGSGSSLGSGNNVISLREHEDELRELFLDIIMKGGVLPVAQLDVTRMALVEALVERNILRWRDPRIRKREARPSMKAGWVPSKPPRFGSGGSTAWYEYRREDDYGEGSGDTSPSTPSHQTPGGENAPAAGTVAAVAAAAASGDVGATVGATVSAIAATLSPKATTHAGAAARVAGKADTAGSSGEQGKAAQQQAKSGGVFGGLLGVFGRSNSTGRPALQTTQPANGASGVNGAQSSRNSQDGNLNSPTASVPYNIGSSPWEFAERDAGDSTDGLRGPALPSLDDQWAGVVVDKEEMNVAELDAEERLALFAREGAELVWASNLVRTVCEAFVSSSQLQW